MFFFLCYATTIKTLNFAHEIKLLLINLNFSEAKAIIILMLKKVQYIKSRAIKSIVLIPTGLFTYTVTDFLRIEIELKQSIVT